MSITLDELKGVPTPENHTEAPVGSLKETGSGKVVRTFNPEEIGAPAKPEESSIAKTFGSEMDRLDLGIMESQQRAMEAIIKPRLEEEARMELEKIDDEDENNTPVEEETVSYEKDDEEVELDETSSVEEVTHKSMDEFKTVAKNEPAAEEYAGEATFFASDEEDDEDEYVGLDNEEEDTEELEQIKKEIKANIKPINNVIDLTKFTISKKPVSSLAFKTSIERVTKKTADWVLFASKQPISMTALSGTELDHFNPRNINNSRNKLNVYKQLYTIMYDHVDDPNKPNTLEAWTKTLPFYDINHLYFAIYRACYADCNIIPYACNKCGKTSMINIPIEDMVKFETEDIKKEFYSIYNKDTVSKDTYKAELIQISDDFVAAVKLPSVFSVVFENAALDEKYLNKHSDMLGLISYIDTIYYINKETSQLEEVKIKNVPGNFSATTKAKVKHYGMVLSSLTSDQYNNFVSKMQELMDSNDGITYIQPAAKCPHCGADIAEATVDPLDMVFTRHQLGAISNL